MDAQQKRELAAVALLTAWLEDEDGTSGFPASLVSDYAIELGSGDDLSGVLDGVLALVAGLTSVAGQLLVRSADVHGTSEEQELQTLSLLLA
jgi:hypothetical protein